MPIILPKELTNLIVRTLVKQLKWKITRHVKKGQLIGVPGTPSQFEWWVIKINREWSLVVWHDYSFNLKHCGEEVICYNMHDNNEIRLPKRDKGTLIAKMKGVEEFLD